MKQFKPITLTYRQHGEKVSIKMKKVEIHKILSNGNISGCCDIIITDIDKNDRIFRLFGLHYGLAMEKVEDDIYQSQYGEKFIIIR